MPARHQSVERCPVGEVDVPAALGDPAAALELGQHPADDLACGAELGGELLLRGLHRRPRVRQLDQLVRESDVEASEGDVVDQPDRSVTRWLNAANTKRRNSAERAIMSSNTARGMATARMAVSATASATSSS